MARRTLLALLLCATMLSGCTGITAADWGDDGIEVDWNGPDNPVNIKSAFGNNSMMSNLTAVGCNDTGKMPSKDDLYNDTYEPAMPVVLVGWVSAVHHYQNGAGMYEDSISRAVSTAVIIQHMSYDSAVSNYDNGVMGKRVQVKDWGDPNDDGLARPFAPDTAGKPKLEMQEEETDFHAAGLIPASADVLEGMEAINWHKPVMITGYMLYSPSAPSPYDYYWTNVADSIVKTTANCELLRTSSDGFRGNILVMTIETPDDRITLNEGYSSSVGGLNTWFFTILVLIIGGGGAFGMFIFSTLMQRHGAASAAKVLLGEGGLAAARQVMAEAKEARKEGLDEVHTSIAKKQEKTKKDEVEDVSIKGFSLDSILSTESSSVGPAEVEGGGVQLTVEADEIAHKMETGEYDVGEESVVLEEEPAPRSFSISGGSSSQDSSEGGFVGGSGRVLSSPAESEPKRHFSSAQASINEPSGTPTRKTIKTRKTRQSSSPQDQKESAPSGDGPPKKKRGPPPKRRQSVAEDDGDFSDFSF
ncbi:MAG TPA: hypothetical protein EYN46_01790 [Candidatus Poseidoniales archaeon]|nr:MAG: hypothetical protein CXX80_06010 [Euryarchaeota archaeon]HIA39845.1 hypothetical protein [Candidatus Poseidoniales archaeon]HIA90250.1 hypothetical protein [Candidatus Poseidoniales archaeon]HIO94075.1 hypothetical protein [Candidatus Poseidoniales archaeon]